MRPNGRGELDSLYFTYPHFDAPATREGLDRATPVVIVGAGPVGMTAALVLAEQGIASVLIDRKDTFNDGSRAICVARQSYYILESIKTVQPFLDKALGWTTGRTFYRGQQILEFDMPDSPDEKYRPMYNIEQQYIEDYLWQAVAANPLIDARWQTEITAMTQDDDGVTVKMRDPNGTYTLTAQWLLAADGARSAVRGMCGLRLKGENFEGRYVIADVRMQHDYPTIRRALFDPASRPGGTVLVHRQPDDIWRIDYQLKDDESAEEATREENVRVSVEAVLKDIGHTGGYDLEWWSVYSANTLALDDYRLGRVFFIGDSAHIVPIFGVRGLNNGLADAQNIGWKLGWVMNGKADAALLDSYSPERRGATLDVFANASKSTRFMTPPSHGWQVMRDAALSLALKQSYAGALANPRQMTPYTYADSPATLADDPDFSAGPVPGAVSVDPRIDGGHLSDQLRDITVLAFGTAPDIAPRDGVRVLTLSADSAAARAFDAVSGTVYVIRPDMHIAARWRSASPADIDAALDRLNIRKGISA
ncbi:FAD-dependent monooxygenase [Actibacterium sp.]|uniref:FAD-dependent monooxygenase n=1 Tax=Actibacterium sp. TaxID=1872125 RepID=UPI003565EB2C